jgi:hypothetical protein
LYVKSDMDLYFQLNDTERRIVRTAARMGDTPGSRLVFELYFPTLPPERLRILRREIGALKDIDSL